MMNKKWYCVIAFLLFLFPAITQCMLVELKKQSDISPSYDFFSDRKSKYEQDVLEIKKELDSRREGFLVRGWSPRASAFLLSVYSAKTGADFERALMARGPFFIQLYCKEDVKGCSALGVVIIAEAVSFAEKKKFIKKLLDKDYECNEKEKHNFTPTVKDKEFAFFTKFKAFSSSIIQEMHCAYYDAAFKLILSQDVKNYIAELLFLLTLDVKESLL